VLLDYSYAGYNHGESAPADGFAWGYKVINVKERMENDNLSAREALNLILYENKLVRKCPGKTDNSNTNATAKIVIYFRLVIMICSRKEMRISSLKSMEVIL